MSSFRQKKNKTAPAGGGGGQKNPLKGYSSADLQRERWAMVKTESILSWDPAEKMPEFRELVARGDIEWLDLPETEILKGERLQNYWITSHRWVHRDHPDWDPDDARNQGQKLRELQRMLRKHPHIRGVCGWAICVCHKAKRTSALAFRAASAGAESR